MHLDVEQSLPTLNLLNRPSDRFAQGFGEPGATGLADGRQSRLSQLLYARCCGFRLLLIRITATHTDHSKQTVNYRLFAVAKTG